MLAVITSTSPFVISATISDEFPCRSSFGPPIQVLAGFKQTHPKNHSNVRIFSQKLLFLLCEMIGSILGVKRCLKHDFQQCQKIEAHFGKCFPPFGGVPGEGYLWASLLELGSLREPARCAFVVGLQPKLGARTQAVTR